MGLNEYVVTTQFRVRRGAERAGDDDRRAVIPDLVLFVNGIPLVVMEAKSPSLPGGLEVEGGAAVASLPGGRAGVAGRRARPALFETNLICVAHCGADAAYAAVGAPENAYVGWKSIEPFVAADFEGRFGVAPEGQARLIAGLLNPATLLDVLRDFVVFEQERGRLVKKLPRYQQYRATRQAVARVLDGRTPPERGGVVVAHAGVGQVADDALPGDEAAALAGAAQPDDRRRDGPPAARPSDHADVRAHRLPEPGARRQHGPPARAAGHEQRSHGDDDDPEVRGGAERPHGRSVASQRRRQLGRDDRRGAPHAVRPPGGKDAGGAAQRDVHRLHGARRSTRTSGGRRWARSGS